MNTVSRSRRRTRPPAHPVDLVWLDHPVYLCTRSRLFVYGFDRATPGAERHCRSLAAHEHSSTAAVTDSLN
jgi:hypothetical protein